MDIMDEYVLGNNAHHKMPVLKHDESTGREVACRMQGRSTLVMNMKQVRSHWLGWSGFNLITFTQFIQHRFNKLINSVALKTTFIKTLLYSYIFGQGYTHIFAITDCDRSS